jgi:putative copper resistance protein D
MTGGWAELLVPSDAVAVLIETRFGWIWIGRLALAAGILGLVFFTQKRTRALEFVLLLVSGILTATLAAVGHGSFGDAPLREAHFFGDAIHLLCAAAWLGGLLCLALLLRRANMDDNKQSMDLLRVTVMRFSRLGYIAVSLLLATGVLNTISIVPRPELLVTSEYGRILLIKMGLVAVMVGVALVNRFILAPRLQKTERSQPRQANITLYRSIAVEQALGLLVLGIVAVLGMVHPTQ